MNFRLQHKYEYNLTSKWVLQRWQQHIVPLKTWNDAFKMFLRKGGSQLFKRKLADQVSQRWLLHKTANEWMEFGKHCRSGQEHGLQSPRFLVQIPTPPLKFCKLQFLKCLERKNNHHPSGDYRNVMEKGTWGAEYTAWHTASIPKSRCH